MFISSPPTVQFWKFTKLLFHFHLYHCIFQKYQNHFIHGIKVADSMDVLLIVLRLFLPVMFFFDTVQTNCVLFIILQINVFHFGYYKNVYHLFFPFSVFVAV